MDPQLNNFISSLELSGLGDQKALENTRNMSKIEFIMEIQGSLSESSTNGLMKGQSWFNQTWHLFLNLRFEVFQMSL